MKTIQFYAGILLIIWPVLSNTLHTQSLLKSDNFTFHGQIRTGYYFIETKNNAGEFSKTPEWRMRARFGFTYRVNEKFSFTSRLAGRYSTEQDKFAFWYHPYGASSGGLRLGQTAFDMFFIEWSDKNRWMVQLGRMQHGFHLRGILAKGIDRYTSSNVSIQWVDGIWLRYLIHPEWYVHIISQYNHRKGTTSYYSSPINFIEPASRFTFFAAVEGKETSGLWNQRELSITLMPSSFRNNNGENTAYWALTGRLGINLPLDISFMNIMIAGEAGYAPATPAFSQLNLSTDVESKDCAVAWQASLNFQDIFKNHNIGFLYGHTDPGWLIAPSFRNNTNTFEVRHQYRFNRKLSSEIRYRIRNQLIMPIDASIKRKDDDLYVRITYRF